MQSIPPGSRAHGHDSTYPPPPPRISERAANPLAGRRLAALALLLGGLHILAPLPSSAQVTAPSVPQNVQATAGDKTVTLTWEAPSTWGTWADNATFLMEYRRDGTSWVAVSASSGANNVAGYADLPPTSTRFVFRHEQRIHYDISGNHYVSNGTTYHFRISTSTQEPGSDGLDPNHYRGSSWVTVSATPQAATSAPGALTSLTATPGAQKLDLAWTAPSVDIYDYDVHITSSTTVGDSAPTQTGGFAAGWVDSILYGYGDPYLRPMWSHGGIANNIAYRVRVRAVNSAGAGPWAFVSGTPGFPAPSAVVGLAVTPSSTRLRVTWTAPPEGATSYEVHYTSSTTVADDAAAGTSEGTQWVPSTRAGSPTSTTQRIATLANGTPYRVRVRAVNSGGSGPWAWGTGTPGAAGSGSTDASLSALVLEDYGGTVTLTPAFASATYGYTADVTADLGPQVTVTPTVNESNATVKVGMGTSLTAVTSGSPSSAIDLAYGANTITVQVTAQEGNTRNYTITVDRALPQVSWPAAARSRGEGSGAHRFPTMGPTAPSDISGTLTYAPGATHPANLADDLGSGRSTTFTASASDSYLSVIEIPIVDDAVNEEHETFTVTIDAGTGYVVGSPATITLTITDNDPPAAPGSLAVAAGNTELTASWQKPAGPVAGYKVRWKLTSADDQAATTANDPSTGWVEGGEITSTNQKITGLTNGESYDVQVRATDGQTATGNGYGAWTATQQGTMGSSNANLSGLTASSATSAGGTFTALTLAPTFSASTTGYTATVAGNRTHAKLTPTVADATATVGVRKGSGGFTAVISGSASEAIALDVGSNAITVRVTAQNGTTKDYTATITRQPPPPTVILSASPNPVTEGSSVTVTATLSQSLSSSVSIPVTLTDNTAESGDHGSLTSITINSGATSGTGTISTNQDTDEDDERFTVALGTLPSSVTAGSPSSVTITISDDDTPAATVRLSASPNPVTEGSSVTVTATLSSALTSNVSIPVTLTDNTAESGDHGSLTSITINSGATSGTGTISTNQDSDEDDERFTVALDTANLPSTVAAGSPSSVRITISDDDTPPATVRLSARPNPVNEGSSVTVTARLSKALAEAVTVPLTVTRNTSEAGDHGTLTSIEIPARSTTATGTITTAEDADTDDETFTVAFGSLPASLRAGDTSSVQVTIADGDARASLTVDPNPVKEGGSVTVTVTLSRALRSSVTVPVTLTRNTSESEDHGTLSGVRVNARATSGTARIAIRQDDDTHDEAFTVAIDTGNLPSNVVAGSPTSARVTIDDDDTPTVSLYVTPSPVVAGEPATVEARISAALPSAVTIPLTLRPGRGADASDYGSLSGIAISAGATSGTGRVSTTRDADQEYESFWVELDTGSLPAQVGAGRRASVRVTISPAPQTTATAWLAASPNPVDEGAAVTVTAHLDEALNRDVTITISIREDGDMAPRQEIHIAAGATSGTYVLQTKHDDDARDGELTVGIAKLSDGVWHGITEDQPSSLRITIKDDEAQVSGAAQSVWLLPAASDPWLRGTLRVANRSATPGEATLRVTDDSGRSYGPLTLALGAHAAAQFDAADLERGNPAKGLTGSTGPGAGDWRIDIDSLLEIEATAYAQASDGFAAPLDAVVPARDDGTLEVALFNPAREVRQRSLLRLVNPGAEDAPVTVSGVDDAGRPGRAPLRLVVPAGAACTLDAAQLESGTGLACGVSQTGLGDGRGRWRLAVVSEAPLSAPPLVAMNLLASPDGRLSNLSSVGSADSDGVWRVALFPAGSDPGARRGLLRIANRAGRAGRVLIQAADDSAAAYPALSLGLAAGQTLHVDSWDLELGNRAKGLAPGTGVGRGAWRLALAGDIEFEAHAYVRAPDGFLSALPASRSGRAHRVALLEPRRGVLRLVNPGAHGASVLVSATDDVGRAGAVRVAVPAGAAVDLTAAALESGEAGAIVSGALGDGTGGWRLSLEADRRLSAMSLLAGPGGHTAELSGTRREAAEQPPQPPPGGPHAAAEPRAEGDARDAR